MRQHVFVPWLVLLALVVIGAPRVSAAPPAAAPPAAILTQCAADLQQRLKVSSKEIGLESAVPVVWPDTALGMPEPGKMYAQVLTPGWKVILKARHTLYLYTTSAAHIKYGGPVMLWGGSLLYLTPIRDEPNLNGDLYRCSLLGTNSARVVAGVSEYFPQANGAVIITRRTSRSSHDLLLVKTDGKIVPLHGAFAFGPAALNDAGTAWAAFVRPRVGGAWTVVVGKPGEGKTRTLDLPVILRPENIAWEGERLLILAKKGEETVCYETAPAAEKPTWKTAPVYFFPERRSYMLNKSETLEIRQVTVAGKPAVEVSRVWFTGDRKVVATMPGLTLRGHDFLGNRFAVVWGELDGAAAVNTVDIATGEIIPGPRGIANVTPTEFPAANTPLTR
ncbi:MAG: hypothetical protein BWY76_00813 [bacterium ADurb.Bin429]|nr:MAG: hypothetical protein BWY76_00813 [bacterium ADurb.Bin429]